MNIPGKSLMAMCLAVTNVAAAPSDGALPGAPSAVNEIRPAIKPLAGMLFFGRQQRDRMDRVRTRGGDSVENVFGESAPSLLNGFVKRSDGYSAIWVDGQPRFNVQSENVRQLQPGDVGGPADTIRVVSHTAATPVPVSRAARVNSVTPRKTSRKRPASTR